MPEKKIYSCLLCNSSIILNDGECQVCGGKHIKYLGFNLGYVYPAEAKYIKFLINMSLFFLLTFMVGIVLLVINLNQILSRLF